MADITAHAYCVFEDGKCGKAALYAVNNATAGDTIDVGTRFAVVKRAGMVSQTATTIAAIGTIAGTVLTVPSGPAADGVWLIVVGVSA